MAGGEPGEDLSAILGALADPVVIVSADDGSLLWANDTAERMFGWSRDTMIGADATLLVHPDDLTTAQVSLDSVQEKVTGTLVEIRVRDHTGEYRRVEVRGRPVRLWDKNCVVLGLRDLTDRRRWELGGGDEAVSSAVLEVLPSIALVLTPDGQIRSANRAFTRLLGHPLDTVLDRPLTDFVSVADVLGVSEQLVSVTDGRGRVSFEAELIDVSGEPHPMSITVVDLVADGAVQGLVAAAADIAALAAARDRLAHAATHDDLTGLPNRLMLHEHLELALSNAAMRDVGVGVVFADVEGFGQINEDHGHRAGDLALVEVGHRLATAMHDSDLVARYGGDEFVMVASGFDLGALARLVDRVTWLMRTPVVVELGDAQPPVEVRLTLTIGAVLAEPGISTTEALERADAAMQRERSRRRPRHA